MGQRKPNGIIEMAEPIPTLSERDITRYALQYYEAVLKFFGTHSTAVATVDELAAAVSDRQGESRREIAIRLHHATLPKLAEAGLIDYDARSTTARYWGIEQGDRLTAETEG